MQIPILQLDDVLLTSIQADLTDQDVIDFQASVLTAVSQTQANGIVIDITGLEIVDSFMARVFQDTATMVRILGTATVISGMRPAVALTLVEMGQDIVKVDAALNLEAGLIKVRELIEEREAPIEENKSW